MEYESIAKGVLAILAAFLGAAMGPYMKVRRQRAEERKAERDQEAKHWTEARTNAAKPWQDLHRECMEGRSEDAARINNLERTVGELTTWKKLVEEGAPTVKRAGRRATDPELG